MNPNLKRLFSIAEAPQRRILGLMSGTSLDGLDMALCLFKGSGHNTEWRVENFYTYPYSDDFRETILKVCSKERVDLQDLCLVNEWLGLEHGKMIREQIMTWGLVPSQIDIIASHGQSVYHSPKSMHKNPVFPNGTLQIGDGDHISQTTQIITLSDFRQKQIAAGGEGAPLAPYGDYILFSSSLNKRLLINIGGISNFTYLPIQNQSEGFQSSDLGPGNTLMDRFVQLHYPGFQFDPNGEFSIRGNVNRELLKVLLEEPFFDAPIPKSTGPELFNLNWLNKKLESLDEKPNKDDILATLNEFSAESIYKGIEPYLVDKPEIYLSGGGIHNKALFGNLMVKISPLILRSTSDLGLNPDAKEAVLFALLANEGIAGRSNAYGMPNSLYPQVSMGKISLPN